MKRVIVHILRVWIVFALLAVLGLIAPASRAQTPPSLTGDWFGSLTAGGATLRLVAHFISTPDGPFNGTLDSVDQAANGIPFSQVTLTKNAVHLESKAIGALYDGKLSADGKVIVGTWSQGNGALPLTWTRTDHPPTLNRPQEPKPPFPYTVKEVTFPDAAAGVTLAGTLTEPTGSGPFPAVLLIAGSGPNDRNETIFGHKSFWVLADALTRRGLAVLRYDKRGIGASTGDYKAATSADFANDAEAGLKYLQTLPEISPGQIGLIGHSEGGLIAPMIAARSRDVAFIVLLAGPGQTGEQILLKQGALIGRAEGASAAQIAENQAVQKKMFAVMKRETSPAVAEKQARQVVTEALAKATPQERKKIGNPKAFVDAQSSVAASPWFRYFLTYDPIPALKKVQCPTLALDGSRDLQVPPQEDLAAIKAALKAGGNTDYTVKELPGLNHLFQTATTGSPSEYARIEETFSPAALTLIGDWIAVHMSKK